MIAVLALLLRLEDKRFDLPGSPHEVPVRWRGIRDADGGASFLIFRLLISRSGRERSSVVDLCLVLGEDVE